MKADELTRLIMNPIRMRMIQYLIVHKTGTAALIGEELNDVPKASLYRHIKLLENAGMIQVVQENKKRGTVEKVYQLNPHPFPSTSEPSHDELRSLVQSMLLNIMGEFQQYFERDEIDPAKDMISVSSSTLLLTDEEFQEFFGKLGEILSGVTGNKPDGKRKPRRITFISSPI